MLVVATIDLLAHAAGGDESRRIAGLLPLSLLHDSLSVAFAAGVIGVVVGAWSAAMGLGGGLLAVPALVLLFGREQHVAEGTSLVIMLPNAIAGAVAHVRQGTASPRLGVIIGVGALVGSVVGVGIALHLATHVLEYAFGAFMVLVIVRESISFRRKYLRH